jgi:Mycothiol maleylpyruvate isomerase N-terminal domain
VVVTADRDEPVLLPGRDEPVLLPAGLRERVLDAAWQARPAGGAFPEIMEISPVEAFSRAADAFYGLLCALGDGAWPAGVLRGLDTQRLVGHLIGVEEDVHRGLAGDAGVADADHIASTQLAADRQAGRSPVLTRSDWRRAADRTLDLVSPRDLGAGVAVHGMRLPLGTLLVVRAFELWTHDNDIRTAAGLPLSVPDTPTLRLMTDLAARMLPLAAAQSGGCQPTDVHLVLTGPGGGTWDVMLGADPGASVGIVTDAVGFCRLAANRVAPGHLDTYVTGDADRVAAVLTATAALALD